MRPDYSLLIRPTEDEPASFEPVVLHFDAKYRVDFVTELFGCDNELGDAESDQGGTPERIRRGGALRSDLLKMHSYRDAIRRTAGAYVLYPGGDDEIDVPPFTEYHELLPGLGAFVLRPTKLGLPSGALALRRFLDDVLNHIATRLTQHERARYWRQEVYGEPLAATTSTLDRPSPQTSVLLGFVKSREHWSWIERRKTYNIRSEDRPGGVDSDAALLQSQLLLLYCPATEQVTLARIVSDPEGVSRSAMEAAGYPSPGGDYWCVQVSLVKRHDWLLDLSASSLDRYVQELGLRRGEPTVVTWGTLESVRWKQGLS